MPLVRAKHAGVARDASEEAERIQTEVHRRMSGVERLRLALSMSEMFRQQALTRIRAHHPELDELGARKQLAFELYGIRRDT
ncbi:MAG: hypothetical protein SFV15_18680 [Polyangiaceae bacterium]|nr:hypothetical protein [Polyangiaceae bacterium]